MKKKGMTKEQIALDQSLRNQSQDVLERYVDGLRHAKYQIKAIETNTEKEIYIKDFGKEVKDMHDNQVMTIGTAGHEMLIYKQSGQYHFYDPNDQTLGFIKTRTADQVIESVYKYVTNYKNKLNPLSNREASEHSLECKMDFLNVVVTPNEKNVIDPEEIFEPLEGLLNKIREMTGKKGAGKENPELVKESAREELQQFIDQNAGSSDMGIQLLMSDIDRALVYEQVALGQLKPVGQSEGNLHTPFLDLCAAYFNTVYKPSTPTSSDGVCYGLCMIFRELLSQTGSIEETSNIFYSQMNVLTRLAERIGLSDATTPLSEEERELVEKVSAGMQLSMIGLFHASQHTQFSSAGVSSIWRDQTKTDGVAVSQSQTLPLSVMMRPPGSIEREPALSNPIVIYDCLKELGVDEEEKLIQKFIQFKYNSVEDIESLDGVNWEIYVSTELKGNKDFVLAVLRGEFGKLANPVNLCVNISKELKTDIEVVKLFIEKNGCSYPTIHQYLALSEEEEKECLKLYLTRQLSLGKYERDFIRSLSFIPLRLGEDLEIKPLVDQAVEGEWFELEQKTDWEKCGDEAYVIDNISRYSLLKGSYGKTLVHPDLLNNNEVVKAWVTQRYFDADLRKLSKQFPEVIRDIDTQKQIVRSNPKQFRYADSSIKGDVEFIKGLVESSGSDMYWLADASKDILGNEEIMQLAIAKRPECLKYASKEIRGQQEVLLAAVQQDGWALRYATDALKGDQEVVLAAVKNSGHALQYASEELQGNRDVVLAAVRNNSLAVQHIDQSLIKNDLILCKAWIEGKGKLKDIQEFFDLEMLGAKKNELAQSIKPSSILQCYWKDLPQSWQDADDDGKYSPEIINMACQMIRFNGAGQLSQMPEIFQENSDVQEAVVIGAVQMKDDDWGCIRSQALAEQLMQFEMTHFSKLPEELRNNKGFVLNLIKENKFQYNQEQYSFIGENLMKDHDVCIELVLKNQSSLTSIDDSLQTDPGFWKDLIAKNVYLLPKAPDALRDNEEYMAELMGNKPDLVEHASDRLKNDPLFMLKAIHADRYNSGYLGEELKANEKYRDIVREMKKEMRADNSQALEHGTNKLGKA